MEENNHSFPPNIFNVMVKYKHKRGSLGYLRFFYRKAGLQPTMRGLKADRRRKGRLAKTFSTWARHPNRYDRKGIDYGKKRYRRPRRK